MKNHYRVSSPPVPGSKSRSEKMRIRRPIIFLLIAAISTVIGIVYLMPAGTIDTVTAQTKTVNDPPVVDFESETTQTKSAERKKRDARYVEETPEFEENTEASDFYKKRVELSKIREFPSEGGMIPTNSHFWRGLPAIPAKQSDTILIGEVTKATAHITDD